MEQLVKGKGTQFDPKVVDVFLGILLEEPGRDQKEA